MKTIASFQETPCLELGLVEHCIPSRQHPSVNGRRCVPLVLWMETQYPMCKTGGLHCC